jgi:SOS-response transcriptional repressor LexA
MFHPHVARSGNVIQAFFGKVNVIQWLKLKLTYKVKPCDALLVVPIWGDALTGDGINEGDMVIARMNYAIEELTPGKLVLVRTPQGLLVLHAYMTIEGDARFAPSNMDCESYLFRGDAFKILGVVVDVISDPE